MMLLSIFLKEKGEIFNTKNNSFGPENAKALELLRKYP